ncbi:DUF3037 domain-containing protein [Yimella sp. RIT 621]|uniref:DUF3037 domain-containing protein n=1 Tax=Yimella sp. RIT 621 TaxID=2510323 RepID=UPI00101C061F|nr:DUF3037 domain-containing protein [Yimella sp. RIT 621]RYG75892.1 DUF3037 domain-containing protein [Yimella sp. RIT 621]
MIGYQYAVLRFVPAVEREEFVNIGVVVYAQIADHLSVEWLVRSDLVRALAPEVDLSEIETALASLRACAAGESAPGKPSIRSLGARFGWLVAPRSTAIQPGPVHGGLTDDPAAEARRLLDRLVG